MRMTNLINVCAQCRQTGQNRDKIPRHTSEVNYVRMVLHCALLLPTRLKLELAVRRAHVRRALAGGVPGHRVVGGTCQGHATCHQDISRILSPWPQAPDMQANSIRQLIIHSKTCRVRVPSVKIATSIPITLLCTPNTKANINRSDEFYFY